MIAGGRLSVARSTLLLPLRLLFPIRQAAHLTYPASGFNFDSLSCRSARRNLPFTMSEVGDNVLFASMDTG